MKKILLMPDSFKGTLSSIEICSIMQQVIARHLPHVQTVSVPIADGGEGTVEAMLASLGGKMIKHAVTGPLSTPVEGFYGITSDGVGIVEMAAAAGLPLCGDDKAPCEATTYGVGELIADCLRQGCSTVIIGLGGSATTDGGTGAAAALGVRFLNAAGQHFVPNGGTLKDICSIDCTACNPLLAQTRIIAMCDIDNPLYGANGAAHVFAPQKGADPATVQQLDEGLQHLAAVIKRDLGTDVATLPGAGAAGGMGAGLVALLGAKLQMGIHTILDTVGFEALAADADLILTGEGKIDQQSLRGKVVIGISRRAKQLGTPVIAVVGDIGEGAEGAYSEGVTAIVSTNCVAVPFAVAKTRARADMETTVDNLLRILALTAVKD